MLNQPQQNIIRNVFQMPTIFDGAELRAKRKKLRLTQARLAAAFGVSAGALSHWETGRTKPTDDVMHLVEEFLNHDVVRAVEEETTALVPSDRPVWWPAGQPAEYILNREDGPAMRIEGWHLGSSEGQSPSGSECVADLYLTKKGTTIASVLYVASGRYYLTHGSLGSVTVRLKALPWAQVMCRERGVEAFEDFE